VSRIINSIDVFYDGAYITTCKSTTEAADLYGFKRMQVLNLIKSGKRSCHGYVFRYGKQQLKSEA